MSLIRPNQTATSCRKSIFVLMLSPLAAYQFDVCAADASVPTTMSGQVQFDSDFLAHGGSLSVDVSRFEKGNAVLPGMYSVDIYVNQNRVVRTDLLFKAVADTADAQACFDAKQFERVGLNLKKLAPALHERISTEGACLHIGEIAPEVTGSFDFGEQRLDLSVPQVLLTRSARDYVSPELLDSGVTAGMLGYNFNLYSHHSNGLGGAQMQGYLGLNTGFNLGSWHFRHDGSYTFDSRGNRRYQGISTYVQRDLPSLSAQLTIGEAYTTGELFDSTAFRGIRVATDDRMLPDSMRGYAPTVRGVALSNAMVTIRQNGVLIYESTVAPGAFEIDDLYAMGYGGDLNVSVREADGSTHSFSVPFSAVPLALRPAQNRYSFVAGAMHDRQLSSDPVFAQGTWQRGFTNLVTGYAGIIAAPGYFSALVGVALNTSFGAIGADMSRSSTHLRAVGNLKGVSYRLSYAKALPATGTDVTIAAYYYSTGGFFGLSDAMRARDQVDRNPTRAVRHARIFRRG
ncbi:fimbria/pilus outer membrane usher protein [Paraburkholderia terrae]